MGNNISTRSLSNENRLDVNLYKIHSKMLHQNEPSINDFNRHVTSINTNNNSSSTLNEQQSFNMNRMNSTSSFSSSLIESPGWDSSTSTLNNNVILKNFSSPSNYKNEINPITLTGDYDVYHNGPGYKPGIGHITNTFIVDEPDDISDTISTTSGSSLAFPREHDNHSDETATLNPSLLFYSEEFNSLSEAHVKSLLQRDDIEISEIDMWNHLISWGIRNTLNLSSKIPSKWNERDFEALEKTVRNCVPFIRFFQIRPEEFAEYVWPYRKIIPKLTIGNFLREQITGHPPIMEDMTPPRIPSSDIDSVTMTGRHATILANWVQQEHFCGKINLSFNLLYRSSKEGLSSKIFHEKCDDKGPTILVVKLSNSHRIVGAYNPLPYQKSKINLKRRSLYAKRMSSDYSDKNSNIKNIKEIRLDTFLFSFQTRYYPEETALISRIIPEYSDGIVTKQYNGLCFGLGPDLRINLDENERIGKVLPASFQDPILDFEGSFEFEELEVFQVLKKDTKSLTY